MFVKIVVILCYIFRTLSGKGKDPRGVCSKYLRLDKDIVKLFQTDLRLENFWKYVCNEVREMWEKSLYLSLNKKGTFVWNFI